MIKPLLLGSAALIAATASILTLPASLNAGGPTVGVNRLQPLAADDRDGKYKSDDAHHKDILWLLADVADRAAADDGWNHVSDWLITEDRKRISEGLKPAKTGEYAQHARAFREAWHTKYGHEFNAHKEYDNIDGVKVTFSTKSGRKTANVLFPAFGGYQPFDMRLQLEAKDKWRIEVPNDMDAQDFVDGLQDGLHNIVQNKASLFKDEKLGLNSAITQMVHALSFEAGKATSSKKK